MNEIKKHNNDDSTTEILAHTLKIKSKIQTKKLRIWYLELFLFSLLVCVFFGVISEFMLSHANIILATILILSLVGVSVLFDIIGVAVTASDIKPFLIKSYSNNKINSMAIKLIKNADKVNSICSDVVGDVCSILSGASGAAICLIIVSNNSGVSGFVVSILLSSLIASLNVLGKALGKMYAMINAHKIIIKVSKFLTFFSRKGK